MTDEAKIIKPGDLVRTDGDTMPVSTGLVKSVSECGRYVKVEKTYGVKRRWTKTYDRNNLTVLCKQD
jgi:hypothetical protein